MGKKRVALLTAAAVGASLVMTAPASSSPSAREMSKEYSMSNGVIVSEDTASFSVGTAYHSFKAKRGEHHVVLTITDASGRAVRGHYHTDLDGDGEMEQGKDFCSESDPIPVRPGQRFDVSVLFGECPGGDLSIVTQGTITATFTH